MSKAIEIAKRHPGDDHPFKVARRCLTEDQVVALLHDSLEDGYASWKELRANFPIDVCGDVVQLTRKAGTPYWEYINRITRPRTIRVKLADAEVNLLRCRPTLLPRYKKVIRVLRARLELYND